MECATDDNGGQSGPLLVCEIEGETKSSPNLVKQCRENTNKLNKGDARGTRELCYVNVGGPATGGPGACCGSRQRPGRTQLPSRGWCCKRVRVRRRMCVVRCCDEWSEVGWGRGGGVWRVCVCGVLWCGVLCGVVWCGVVSVVVGYVVVWCCVVLCDVVWCGGVVL